MSRRNCQGIYGSLAEDDLAVQAESSWRIKARRLRKGYGLRRVDVLALGCAGYVTSGVTDDRVLFVADREDRPAAESID